MTMSDRTQPAPHSMDEATRTTLESAVWRRLNAHLATRSDVTNAQLMALAGFCRNCLEGYLEDAASDHGQTLAQAMATPTPAIEARAYHRIRDHLMARPEVQNIDLMNATGFCRNCLANWYMDAAKAHGLALAKEAAREIVYGMPYDAWRAQHQREASAEQIAAFETSRPKHH